MTQSSLEDGDGYAEFVTQVRRLSWSLGLHHFAVSKTTEGFAPVVDGDLIGSSSNARRYSGVIIWMIGVS
jgi:hypothetical protein